MEQPQGHGLLLEPQKPEDFVFGAELSLAARYAGREVLRTDGNWRLFLPREENQSTPETETNACATFGTMNVVETLRNRMYGLLDNYSDRMVAKGSGTNPAKGNTPKAVAEYFRKNWSVIEDNWPFSKDMTVEEFYAALPAMIVAEALENGKGNEFGYEYVKPLEADMREALKYSPLGMSVPAWAMDENEKYMRPEGWFDNHWVMCYNITEEGDMEVFDTYAPFFKTVRKDCRPTVVMGYHLTKVPIVDKPKSFWQSIIEFITNIFK